MRLQGTVLHTARMVKYRMSYKIVEIFTSINGESRRAGELATFVRFAGCNLNCSYCDTRWANEADVKYTEMTAEEIYQHILQTGVTNVTLTGGEPLLQPGITELLELLAGDKKLYVEIETNGSVSIEPFLSIENRPSMTLDFKTKSSGMSSYMCMDNYKLAGSKDTVKFVCGSAEDLQQALEVITKYQLDEKCAVYLSPVFGQIEPADMVEFMKTHKMNKVKLQLQLHKFIWDPDKKGV